MFGLPVTRKDTGTLVSVKRRATNIVKGQEHMTYGERLREQDLFSLGKRQLGDFTVVYNHLMGRHMEDRARLYLEVDRDRMKVNQHILQQGTFKSDIGKK